MNQVRKFKDMLLHANNLRKFAGFVLFSQAIRSELKLKILPSPAEGSVLVVSPHPDDDVFGIGGTLRLHTNQNDPISVVYLANTKETQQERESEARASAKLLGMQDPLFWNIPDGSVITDHNMIKKFQVLLQEIKPRSIYVPSFIDPHPDHFEAARLIYETLKTVKFDGEIFLYEIWQPVYANRLICIDSVIDIKKQAIQAHISQLKDRHYLEAILGLNQYRANMYNAGNYAEAFFACNKELYLKLFELLQFKK